MVNTTCKVVNSFTILRDFAMDAELLDIGNRDVILGLSCLTENGFYLNMQYRCVRNITTGQVIPCSVRWIPEVLILAEEPLKDGEILLIIDTSERYCRYAECFSSEQAARLPKHKSWDRQIPLQDPNAKIPRGGIYKTTWEEDEGLRQYLQENIPTGKVQPSSSAAAVPILFVCKQDRSLTLCVDYRALNCLTVPNKYPLPHISDLLDKTRGGKWFTRLEHKN